jgi:carboxyl-terminal processing protease
VRGYALALTTARYYTPSGRSIQRDYGSTALEDYYVPNREKSGCEEGDQDARLTDAGRKVFGGDGITPDYCVSPEPPDKFVSHLITRAAFVGFSRGFEASGSSGLTQIAGTGSRSEALSKKVKPIGREFVVDDAVLADFKAFLQQANIAHTPEELAQHREEISRRIQEEVLRQSFGEGEARRRTLAWDPQVQKALALAPKAEVLLRDPKAFIAAREAEGRMADAESSK